MTTTSEWVAIGISVLALGISGFTAYSQFWPNDETRSILSHASFSMDEGRFGRGPRLLTALSFVNRGNRPVILSKLIASFGYSDGGGAAQDCEIGSGRWAGVPWDTAISHGEEITDALPRAILPGVATATVYTFEPNPTRANKELEKQALMVCLDYEMISSDGEVVRTRYPIGIVEFSNDRIEDVVFADAYRDPVTVNP